jgi:hypothetical protein
MCGRADGCGRFAVVSARVVDIWRGWLSHPHSNHYLSIEGSPEVVVGKDRTGFRHWLGLAAVALSLSAWIGCRGKSSTPAQPPATTEAVAATPMPLNDAQRHLAQAFVAAINAKDAAAVRSLIVPQALACDNSEDAKAFVDKWVHSRLRMTIPPGYKLSFAPYEQGFQPSKLFTPPVQATQRMDIEFDVKPGQGTRLSSLVSEEKGGYYLFLPCITAAGVQNLKSEQARRVASLKKAHEVYGQLKDPQRSQLTELAKKGKTANALQACRQQLGTDFRTSGYLLDLLAGRNPDLER